ncbi:MAG: hypothetical protein IJ856_01705 [Candidatus Methanomethylophilaceae archaeon]|nr:hypothetical protein [Candidatus Methanomethylophilaceae archaeon]
MFDLNYKDSVMRNARKALDSRGLVYETTGDKITLGVKGDDFPIGMAIVPNEECKTLNIYCVVMFEIPEHARSKLIPELNSLNNTINNGGYFMTEDSRIIFKIVQSYNDCIPSVKTLDDLIGWAFSTVDAHDGKLKELIPEDAVRKDVMFQ